MKIEVTQVDIDSGVRRNSVYCAVATAIGRTIPTATYITVTQQSIRLTLDDARHVYLTPPRVGEYVIAFDAGDEIKPFSFGLADPIIGSRSPKTAGRARTVKKANAATYSRSARSYGMCLLRVNQDKAKTAV